MGALVPKYDVYPTLPPVFFTMPLRGEKASAAYDSRLNPKLPFSKPILKNVPFATVESLQNRLSRGNHPVYFAAFESKEYTDELVKQRKEAEKKIKLEIEKARRRNR